MRVTKGSVFYRCFEIGKKTAAMAGPCERLSIVIIFEGSNTEVKCVVSDLSVEIKVKNNPPWLHEHFRLSGVGSKFLQESIFYTVK